MLILARKPLAALLLLCAVVALILWRLNVYIVQQRQEELNRAIATPLVLAVLNPNPDVVQALLDAGANVGQKDSLGETAWDIDSNGEDSIYWMLEAAEAKQKKNHALKGTAIERGR